MALAHHSVAPKLEWNPDEDDGSIPVPSKFTEPQMLPGRHPSVEKALDGMQGDLEQLKEKKLAAKQTRGELAGKVTETVQHMNDALALKRSIMQKEAKLRIEGNKLKKLEREGQRMDGTHTSLVNSLHRVLEPKLKTAEQRLAKKELILAKEEKAAKGWSDKREELHAHALELLAEKKTAQQSLLQAERDVEEVKKREEAARSAYDAERRKVAQEVQSFRYAETRFKAELAHKESAKESATAAKESVNKLNKVLEMESVKVEESVEVSKGRIHHRIEEIQSKREKTEHELQDLKQKYHDWQENQRQRSVDVVKKGEETAEAAEAYADQQKQVLDNAAQKVVNEAGAQNDWAWDKSDNSEAGFTESNPSFSD
jgi:chromosome segregation ATPase